MPMIDVYVAARTIPDPHMLASAGTFRGFCSSRRGKAEHERAPRWHCDGLFEDREQLVVGSVVGKLRPTATFEDKMPHRQPHGLTTEVVMGTTVQSATENRPFRVDNSRREARELRDRIAGDALALPGAGRRSVAGRAVGDDQGARPLLEDRVRLAQGRGKAQCLAAVHNRDRRGGHPLHPRQIGARERAAADHDHGWPGSVVEMIARRPPDRPYRARRQCRGCLPPRAALPARVRVLRRAGRDRLGPGPHRAGVGRADAPPWLHPLRRPGRRRGRRRHRRDGSPGTRGADRHPHEPARASAGRHHAERQRRGTRRGRADRHLPAVRKRLLRRMATRPQTIGYALLDSPVALAAWMVDHDTDAYYKISHAFVDGRPSGNLTRDHILDNITLYWLTGQAPRRPGPTGRPTGRTPQPRAEASAAADHPVRFHDVPRRDLADSAQLGRGSTRTSATSTRSTRAATSPPGRSRSCSRPRSGPRSARCVYRRWPAARTKVRAARPLPVPSGIPSMRAALQVALDGAANAGAETELLDLHELGLPIYNPDNDGPTPAGPGTADRVVLRGQWDALEQPDVPGHDLGARSRTLSTGCTCSAGASCCSSMSKVIGLISAADGTQGLGKPWTRMEFVVFALGGWAAPDVVPVPAAARIFDATGPDPGSRG